MTPEAQRIAIAEACEWKEVRPATCVRGQVSGVLGNKLRDWVPDYLADLNAIHDAENRLEVNQWHEYMDALYSLVQDPHICPSSHGILYVTATAPQRCEALLRTLGLWEASK